MRFISLAPLAVAVSRAGGLGFIGAGENVSDLDNQLQHAKTLLTESPVTRAADGVLPIGVGIINWGADLETALNALKRNIPAAVWLFAPKRNADLVLWANNIREITHRRTKIWIQIGTVADALEIAEVCDPDVLVVQGMDAGGHGLERTASIVSLLPEISDVLQNAGKGDIKLVAAGGIVEGRGVAAALALGSQGVAIGTRFLASREVNITTGYQADVLRSKDGSVSTVRTKVYDTLRGTTGWPGRYGGRGIINESFHDAENGQVTEENRKKYQEALERGDQGWGEHGRLTAYAGTGVGLVKKVQHAWQILEEIRNDVQRIQSQTSNTKSKL
ncbi:MAG: hypothetical protein Q9191_006097 [Dirinaria sp. TL-2023a]